MARRPPDEQEIHDRVIGIVHERLVAGGRVAHTNPGKTRMSSISGHFPDVLAMHADDADIVQTIYEVETWSSVEERHAEWQWTAFAGLGVEFVLVVPADTLEEAKRILRELKIAPRLVAFRDMDRGGIELVGEIMPSA